MEMDKLNDNKPLAYYGTELELVSGKLFSFHVDFETVALLPAVDIAWGPSYYRAIGIGWLFFTLYIHYDVVARRFKRTIHDKPEKGGEDE
jgi:hypothetical protein